MDLSKLQLKLEDMGLKPEDIDEILLTAAETAEAYEKVSGFPESNLVLLRENEDDWRKRAVIAAEIIKRGLET